MVGHLAVHPGQTGRLIGLAGEELAADHAAHLGADPLAVGVVQVAAHGREHAQLQVRQGDFLGGPAHGHQGHPLLGDVGGGDVLAGLFDGLDQRQLVGDVIIESVWGTGVIVDLTEDLADVLGDIPLHSGADGAGHDLTLPAQMGAAQEVLARHVILVGGEGHRRRILLEALVDGVLPVGVIGDLGGVHHHMPGAGGVTGQGGLVALTQVLLALLDHRFGSGHVIAHVGHVLHAADDDVLLRVGAGDVAVPLHGHSGILHHFQGFGVVPALLLLLEDHGDGVLHGFQFDLPGFLAHDI